MPEGDHARTVASALLLLIAVVRLFAALLCALGQLLDPREERRHYRRREH